MVIHVLPTFLSFCVHFKATSTHIMIIFLLISNSRKFHNMSLIIFTKRNLVLCNKKNPWLNILNDYIIDYSHKILLQILCVKSYSHILMLHLTSKWWCFFIAIFIHMAFMINEKMMWMSKISFENVTRIKIISNITKEWLCRIWIKWCVITLKTWS